MIVDEEAAIRERHWHPQPGEVVIDVGSCDGAYTIPALEAGATVYAIDARAHTLDAIPHHPSLVKIHRAIYDGRAYPPELLDAIANGPHASSREMVSDARWSTIDSFRWPRVDWIKIDVEGGELGVLRGAVSTIIKHHPKLLIEDHSRVYPWVAQNAGTERILALLAAHGYDTQHVTDTYPDYIVATR